MFSLKKNHAKHDIGPDVICTYVPKKNLQTSKASIAFFMMIGVFVRVIKL